MEEDEELFVHLSDDESGEIDDLPPSNVVDTQVQTDYYPYTYTGLVKIHGPSISSRENCYKNLFILLNLLQLFREQLFNNRNNYCCQILINILEIFFMEIKIK